MGSKIWCQVGEFDFHFQNSYGEMCFWKIMLKVRSFKSTGDHRPFLSNFDVKLGILFLLQQKFRPSRYTLPPGSSAIYGRGAERRVLSPEGSSESRTQWFRFDSRSIYCCREWHWGFQKHERWQAFLKTWFHGMGSGGMGRGIKSVLQISSYFVGI